MAPQYQGPGTEGGSRDDCCSQARSGHAYVQRLDVVLVDARWAEYDGKDLDGYAAHRFGRPRWSSCRPDPSRVADSGRAAPSTAAMWGRREACEFSSRLIEWDREAGVYRSGDEEGSFASTRQSSRWRRVLPSDGRPPLSGAAWWLGARHLITAHRVRRTSGQP
jgi:hypothetical protein